MHQPFTSFAGGLSLILLLAGFHIQCGEDGRPAPGDSLALPVPYAFDRPALMLELDDDLHEISGLTVLDDQHLGAVEDETGRLFVLDMQTGAIVHDGTFGKDGDFEGIARVDDRVFTVRSDGTLFEITGWQADTYDAVEYKTSLKRRNDAEGLAYDADHNRLLIACKEYPGDGLEGQKAIYAFDLATNTLLNDPVYTIVTEAFTEEMTSDGPLNDKIREAVSPALDLSGFKPSALAVHPVAGHLYVLSSVRKAIVVLDRTDGHLLDVWPLPEDLFEQPEGLTFLPNGDLFIASEGGGGKATLARFTYQPTPDTGR